MRTSPLVKVRMKVFSCFLRYFNPKGEKNSKSALKVVESVLPKNSKKQRIDGVVMEVLSKGTPALMKGIGKKIS